MKTIYLLPRVLAPIVYLLALVIGLMFFAASGARMQAPTFKQAIIDDMRTFRTTGGTAYAMQILATMSANGTTETRQVSFRIDGAEFQAIPAPGAGRVAYLQPIVKREIQKAFNVWLTEIQNREAAPVVRTSAQITAELGGTVISSLAGAATPTSTP